MTKKEILEELILINKALEYYKINNPFKGKLEEHKKFLEDKFFKSFDCEITKTIDDGLEILKQDRNKQ